MDQAVIMTNNIRKDHTTSGESIQMITTQFMNTDLAMMENGIILQKVLKLEKAIQLLTILIMNSATILKKILIQRVCLRLEPPTDIKKIKLTDEDTGRIDRYTERRQKAAEAVAKPVSEPAPTASSDFDLSEPLQDNPGAPAPSP